MIPDRRKRSLLSDTVSNGKVAHSKSILVVDDDPAICKLLTTLLAGPDREIESSSNGLEALARVRARPYDLIVTDVRMPGIDGLELLRQIRQIRPEVKVVVMTADNTPRNILQAIRDHAFSFFSKPFATETVAETVAQALESGSAEDDIVVLSARPEWIALRLRCKIETADRLLHFLRELRMDLPESERDTIATAFREILMNAIEHGGRSDPEQKVYVTCVRTSRAIVYYVRDPGAGFSMETLPHAAISNPPESPTEHLDYRTEHGIRPGGFGILLVRNMVDELIYNEKGNEVVLIKYV